MYFNGEGNRAPLTKNRVPAEVFEPSFSWRSTSASNRTSDPSREMPRLSAAKIFLDVRVDGHLMGEKIAGAAGSTVEVKIAARCPQPIDRVEICRNNQFIYANQPDGNATALTFVDRDGAIVTVGRVDNLDGLAEACLGRNSTHFSELKGNEFNQTEVVASLIDRQDSLVDGIRHVQEKVDGSCSVLLLNGEAKRADLGLPFRVLGQRGPFHGFDFWEDQPLGLLSDGIPSRGVDPGGCRVVGLTRSSGLSIVDTLLA